MGKGRWGMYMQTVPCCVCCIVLPSLSDEGCVLGVAGGWFHTGDQGFLDEEGFLTLTGRIKELINRGGEKISPIEVMMCMNLSIMRLHFLLSAVDNRKTPRSVEFQHTQGRSVVIVQNVTYVVGNRTECIICCTHMT